MKDKVVLILDDEIAVARIAAFAVAEIGYETIVTTNAAEFFDLVEAHRPDYVVLDLLMPEMDGIEVFVELAKRKTSAKIIILSGAATSILNAARISATEHRLDVLGVVSKPYIAQKLRSLLLGDSEAVLAQFAPEQSTTIGSPNYTELSLALQREELFVVYQPKISCTSGKLVGFEALVRWRHPVRGLVVPDDFIPLAESSGLINPLTRYVASEALSWFAQHFSESDIHLSINVSAINLRNPDFADEFSQLCAEFGVDADRIVCEITESRMMEDSLWLLDSLTRLRLKGIQLSIDDFGTGFSSMERLAQLPFSEIKVDRSFVFTALKSAESNSVVESIIGLGKAIGLRTCAEGVEDRAMLKRLCDLGCDLSQGYFISRPMEGEFALQWLQAHVPADFIQLT